MPEQKPINRSLDLQYWCMFLRSLLDNSPRVLHGEGTMSVPKGDQKRSNPANACPQNVAFFTSVAALSRLAF